MITKPISGSNAELGKTELTSGITRYESNRKRCRKGRSDHNFDLGRGGPCGDPAAENDQAAGDRESPWRPSVELLTQFEETLSACIADSCWARFTMTASWTEFRSPSGFIFSTSNFVDNRDSFW